jgi:hypothetical protein
MITSELFDRIKYHAIRNISSSGVEIGSLTGFDSEAYSTGEPFLFCCSSGESYTPGNVILSLLERHSGEHFAVWNLKYDSGALLYFLPGGEELEPDKKTGDRRFIPGKIELWVKNSTYWTIERPAVKTAGNRINSKVIVRVEYIPHKHLKFSIGKDTWVRFWDIFQFYGSSLDKAAQKYLGEKKEEIETKTFTPLYVEKNLRKIRKYCLQDSKLTGKLGNYFLKKLDEFGIRATALYSSASLSFRYFQDRGEIIHIRRYWRSYKEAVKYAIDSYQGGKFEVTARGSFKYGYEYDIVSAYPYEIANLADIRFARIVKSRRYEKDAYYGFIRIKLEMMKDAYLPCGLLIDNTRVYAIGKYYITVTKAEYEYYVSLGAKVKIISAYWLYIDNPEFPYRRTVNELFKLKSLYKNKDAALYMLAKVMLNGFYGKSCQVIEDWKGFYQAGIGFNPFYASIITANTRLKVTKIQNLLKDNCLAVHTDSVISLCPLQDNYLSSTLGGFELVESGAGVIVLCGCYQIHEAGAFKGFEPAKRPDGVYEDWYDILRQYSRFKKIPYKALRVESWVEATAKGHFDKVNLFQNMPKDIDLNADIKRIWKNDNLRGGDFFKKLYRSEPRIIVQNEKPFYW